MNFAELRFWEILLGLLAVILLVRRVPALFGARQEIVDRVTLSLLGLSLLGAVSLHTLAIFATVTTCTYGGLWLILRRPASARAHWLWLLIPLQLAPLLYYKYAYFLCCRVAGLPFDSLRDLAIPIGISFYTFQKNRLRLRHPRFWPTAAASARFSKLRRLLPADRRRAD